MPKFRYANPPRHNVICGHLYDDETICRQPAGPDHNHDGPPLRDPAPGLYQQMTGRPLPSWTEMQARYGDPAALPPLLGVGAAEAVQRVNEAAAVLRDAVGVSAADVGKVDFRDMLKDDGPAWATRARLEKVLGRPHLATMLADQLDPETAAKLADRLDTIVSQTVAETEMRISRDVTQAVAAKVREISEQRTKWTEEVTHERFGRTTRLS